MTDNAPNRPVGGDWEIPANRVSKQAPNLGELFPKDASEQKQSTTKLIPDSPEVVVIVPKTGKKSSEPTQKTVRTPEPIKNVPESIKNVPVLLAPKDVPNSAGTSLRDSYEQNRMWDLVGQTIDMINNNKALEGVKNGLTLTQDLDKYSIQRSNLEKSIRNTPVSSGLATIGSADVQLVFDMVVDELTGISVLGIPWRDSGVDEILVDSWDKISIERNGKLELTSLKFRDFEHAKRTAQHLSEQISKRVVSDSSPLVTGELPGGRITIALGAVVKSGLSITIRKFRNLLSIEDLLEAGSLSSEMRDFLRDCVIARSGILVSGGTGSGKTTIINILSQFIPDTQRVISIEDAFELKLANTHVVSLQTKEAASMDDEIKVTLADLLHSTLRMRPDRIIVGEIREPAGAVVMLDAASTGHDGTMTTIHASSPFNAVNERLPGLIRQDRHGDTASILRSIVSAFEVIVQIKKSVDGRRYIATIAALGDIDPQTNTIAIEEIFTSTADAKGISFSRNRLRAETTLGIRLSEQGGNRWLQ
jgi:pilus assembly protein CpaF